MRILICRRMFDGFRLPLHFCWGSLDLKELLPEDPFESGVIWVWMIWEDLDETGNFGRIQV